MAFRTATATVHADRDEVLPDLSTAPRWNLLVTQGGLPAARVEIPTPGRTEGDALLEAAILRRADWEAARQALVEQLRSRLGAPPKELSAPSRSISVVVCTHGRPQHLPQLLEAVSRLDPAPLEVIVVDNDPGERDCRAQVEAIGARYVREDRRGLDNARNAGIHAARGEIVAFTDDDCVPPPGWLAALPDPFRNDAVVGVTGPAFPYSLETRAQRRMDVQLGMVRGLRRTSFDWLSFPALRAGAVGVGANMAFRRDALLELGAQPFPPELDAGTITQSGGDTYVIAKLLIEGRRMIYEPAIYTFHQHRADPDALHRAAFGYGVGVSAAMAKLLVEDGETTAVDAWTWLLTQYLRTQIRRIARRSDSVETRLSWDYVRGGLIGARRWQQARAALPAPDAPVAVEPAGGAGATDGDAGPTPAISVIVPTYERPDGLRRCLEALARQDVGPDAFEVIVVDDSQGASVDEAALAGMGLDLRVLRTRGSGAAAARNAGAHAARHEVLLFLDDDLVPQTDLIRRHRRHHGDPQSMRVVVGRYPPAPATPTLIARASSLWWHDLFDGLGQMLAPTYVTLLTGNLSVTARAFAHCGDFDVRFGADRREDWEWGVRARRLGLELVYEPAACASHHFALTSASRLRGSRLEGRGDALLVREHPDAISPALPLTHHRRPRIWQPVRLASFAAWRVPALRSGMLFVLDALERARMRLLWARLYRRCLAASYALGLRDRGARRITAKSRVVDVELTLDTPIPPPALAAPEVRVTIKGWDVARVRPAQGLWTADLAEQIVDEIPWNVVTEAAVELGRLPRREERHDRTSRTEVLLGPAHTTWDRAAAGRLRRAGADVRLLDGDAEEHWARIAEAVAQDGPPFVAFTMPGVRPSAAWLQEALGAFDGDRVGAVFGPTVSDDTPIQCLYLHDRSAPPGVGGAAPMYVVVRREVARALEPQAADFGTLGPVYHLLHGALDAGWVVGYRAVHGLTGHGPTDIEDARALAGLRVREALGSPSPGRGLAREAGRATLLASWALARNRGRLPRWILRRYNGALSGAVAAVKAR